MWVEKCIYGTLDVFNGNMVIKYYEKVIENEWWIIDIYFKIKKQVNYVMRWVWIKINYISMTWCDNLRFYENMMNELCHYVWYIVFCYIFFSCDCAFYLGNVIIN